MPQPTKHAAGLYPARVVIIAAVAQNGIIGRDGKLPWHLPADMRFFKRVTHNYPMIMGRKTRDSFGVKPLPQRPHIVLTHNPHYSAQDTDVVLTLHDALCQAAQYNPQQAFIIGGAQIYALAMPYATHAVITRVPLTPEGDTVLPALAPHLHITEFTPQQLEALQWLL